MTPLGTPCGEIEKGEFIVYWFPSIKVNKYNLITFAGGTHYGITTGRDLTKQFNSCHGMGKIINNLPKVGILTVKNGSIARI